MRHVWRLAIGFTTIFARTVTANNFKMPARHLTFGDCIRTTMCVSYRRCSMASPRCRHGEACSTWSKSNRSGRIFARRWTADAVLEFATASFRALSEAKVDACLNLNRLVSRIWPSRPGTPPRRSGVPRYQGRTRASGGRPIGHRVTSCTSGRRSTTRRTRENFMRLETFGSPDHNWVHVTVDSKRSERLHIPSAQRT